MSDSDLFPAPRRPGPRHQATVTVDGHCLGTIRSTADITTGMRSHGVSVSDIDLVLRGRVRRRSFLCNGRVQISAVPLPAKRVNARAA
ncbi:MAG: hypothetical protein ACREPQ_14240 [Rhodanobacter sp.]